MKTAFTICTNNFLAKARIAAESFMKFHTDFQFQIFLLDTFDTSIDYSPFQNCKIVSIDHAFSDAQQLSLKYNIVELSCAVRPSVFMYLLNAGFQEVIHIDSDTQTYDRFIEVEDLLKEINIVVTPHFCSPIDDGKYPSDIDFIKFGMFNLGFLAVQNTLETKRFMQWWHERLMKYCYKDPAASMFLDQLWVNYAPIFFEGIHILKHKGYNVANWNLYERALTVDHDVLLVNNSERLKFIHYSYYVFNNPHLISESQNRFTIDELPVLKLLFEDYDNSLVIHNHAEISKTPAFYQQNYEKNKQLEKAHLHSNNKKIFYRSRKLIYEAFTKAADLVRPK